MFINDINSLLCNKLSEQTLFMYVDANKVNTTDLSYSAMQNFQLVPINFCV